MRFLCAGVVVFAAMLCGGCGPGRTMPKGGSPGAAANDPQAMEQLKGTWHVIAIEAGGNPVPADRVQKIELQYVFDGDKLTVHRPDRPDKTSTITLDATSSPKKMTLHQSRPVYALYAVDGNKLRLCLMVDENPNAGFPTELASRASPTTDLLTLERR